MNRCAFSFDLKTFNDGDFLISNGKLLHSFDLKTFNDGDFLISNGKLFHSNVLGLHKQMLDLLALFLFYMMGFVVTKCLGSCASCGCIY